MAVGSVELMKELHARWGDEVRFVTVLGRQAHPGPGAPPYRRFEQKLRDAQTYQRGGDIPWPVLVDDLRGTVHQVFGMITDPTYLLDRDGRVAFYNLITGPAALHEAIEELLARGGRGVVRGGVDRFPHLGPGLTAGWPAIRRGLPQSFLDLMLSFPGSPVLVWLGYQLRPLLAPLTMRSRPLPGPAKTALAVGTAGALALGVWWLTARRCTSSARPGCCPCSADC